MAKKPKDNLPPQGANVEIPAASESQADGIVDVIERNRRLLIGGFVALLAILALVIVGKQVSENRRIKAGQAFTAAALSRDIAALDQVVQDHRGRVVAGNALLIKADVQIDNGKPQDAIATLETMAQEFTTHPRHAQAYYMLGNLYHKSGDLAKARENYNQVLSLQPDGELTPITRIRLADIELAEGNAEKARQSYEDSYIKHPGNPFFSTAQARLETYKMAAPIEIDPPAPPKEETEPAETKPDGSQPAEAKPAETKPAETKPAEAKPAEAKPSTETKPAEAKPSTETKPKSDQPEEVKAKVEVVE